MLVLIWVRSPRLVILTNYPALLLTALFIPIDGSAFMFYTSLVLSSAIHWQKIICKTQKLSDKTIQIGL